MVQDMWVLTHCQS